MISTREVYNAHPDDEEIDDVLGQRLSGAVGTLNEDGSIHLAYVIFLYEAGSIWFETASITRKARNAAARPTISFLVQGTAAGGTGLMVAIEGEARVVGGDEAHAIQHRIRAKYVTPDALPALDRAWDAMDDVAIEIVPRRRRSWTGSVLAASTESAIGSSYDEAWIPD
jgi:nitroimidazol reductase NimA-like FMN-containing flavoprotein (pyridoxamine 5'-phosphate oxidase superfamily)